MRSVLVTLPRHGPSTALLLPANGAPGYFTEWQQESGEDRNDEAAPRLVCLTAVGAG